MDALPHVDRWAGRMALNPACFQAQPQLTGNADADAKTARDWAASCGFLDAQEVIEAKVDRDAMIDAKTRVLCPIVLWSSAVNP